MPGTPRSLGEELSSAVLEAAPVALLLVDASARIVFANRRTEAMFGHVRGELVGQPLATLVPDRPWEALTADPTALSGGPIVSGSGDGLPLLGRRKDGGEFPAEVSLGAVPGPRGPIVAVAVHEIGGRWTEDLAERSRTRDALHKSETNFRALFDQAPEGVFIADIDGRCTDVNASRVPHAGIRARGDRRPHRRRHPSGRRCAAPHRRSRGIARSAGLGGGVGVDAEAQGRRSRPGRSDGQDAARRAVAGLRARHIAPQAKGRGPETGLELARLDHRERAGHDLLEERGEPPLRALQSCGGGAPGGAPRKHPRHERLRSVHQGAGRVLSGPRPRDAERTEARGRPRRADPHRDGHAMAAHEEDSRSWTAWARPPICSGSRWT